MAQDGEEPDDDGKAGKPAHRHRSASGQTTVPISPESVRIASKSLHAWPKLPALSLMIPNSQPSAGKVTLSIADVMRRQQELREEASEANAAAVQATMASLAAPPGGAEAERRHRELLEALTRNHEAQDRFATQQEQTTLALAQSAVAQAADAKKTRSLGVVVTVITSIISAVIGALVTVWVTVWISDDPQPVQPQQVQPTAPASSPGNPSRSPADTPTPTPTRTPAAP